MKTSKRALLTALAALILASVVLVGCGDSSDDAQSSADTASADSMFVNGMIPHHQAAVDMATDAQEKATRPEVKELADAIIESQTAEIDQLEAMQDRLPQSDKMAMSEDDMQMMNDDVEKVRSASDFDKAFLLAMVPHHQMAVGMSESVLKKTSDAEVEELATAIISAQEKEIAQMKAWLEDWYGVKAEDYDMGSMDDHSMSHDGM